MSVGNTRTEGNKGTNFPYQIATLRLLESIMNNTAGSGADYELITYNYRAVAAGPGYAIGDFITRTQIVFVPTGNIVSTLWFNQTTGISIVAPAIGNLVAVAPPSAVTVNNLPAVLGQALMINSLAVTIASDQSALPVTNPNLDVLLSTRNAEATQLLIKAKTDNLDVLLSTRATEATQLLVKTAVEAINTKLTTVARVPSAVNVTAGVGGTTNAGVRSVTLWFRGANGSVGGVPVPNNAIMTFTAGAEEDTLNGIAYVRPTTGEARIIITYTT